MVRMKERKKVCWMSAGISSFMAGVLANADEWIYIDIDDQDRDSIRFIKDCEKAIGKEIKIIRSAQYHSVEDCVRAFGGFKARNGFAPCTNWLKMRVRKEWEAENLPNFDVTYVWGFDVDEEARVERMVEANPQAEHEFPLADKCLTKENVHNLYMEMFPDIPRPRMYDGFRGPGSGYGNNNCIGCLKGGMGYWNNIRKDFPEVFQSRMELEKLVGHTILKECSLEELDPNRGNMNNEIIPECGMMCFIAFD